MKTLEESIVDAMDGSHTELVSYLPYILQDLWEIGTASDIAIRLVRKYLATPSGKRILDLGCGKGIVSIKLAKELGCTCLGIDGMEAFIHEAREKAKEWGVERKCQFQAGDIRENIREFSNFDVVVLGAIGPVFGDYLTTLTTLAGCLNPGGLFIIDDSYLENERVLEGAELQARNSILSHIESAGMQLVDEVVIDESEIKNTDDFHLSCIKRRCIELAAKNPAKRNLFEGYIRDQEEENKLLEEQVVSAVFAIRKA